MTPAPTRLMPKNDGDDSDDSFENEDARRRILEILKTFDEDGNELLEQSEVSAALRVLGFTPSNLDLDALFQQLPKTNELYSFEVVLNRVLTASANGDWPRDPDASIAKAFDVIATGGILARDVLINHLTTLGESLTNSELKQLLSHLPVKRNGQVDWKSYMRDTLHFIQQSRE